VASRRRWGPAWRQPREPGGRRRPRAGRRAVGRSTLRRARPHGSRRAHASRAGGAARRLVGRRRRWALPTRPDRVELVQPLELGIVAGAHRPAARCPPLLLGASRPRLAALELRARQALIGALHPGHRLGLVLWGRRLRWTGSVSRCDDASCRAAAASRERSERSSSQQASAAAAWGATSAAARYRRCWRWGGGTEGGVRTATAPAQILSASRLDGITPPLRRFPPLAGRRGCCSTSMRPDRGHRRSARFTTVGCRLTGTSRG
jgi:hypothetical protein